MRTGPVTVFYQPEMYREMARMLREEATVAHTEAQEELELLALGYQRLAEFRESQSRLERSPPDRRIKS